MSALKHPTKANHWVTKLMGGWLLLPDDLCKELDWHEGDELELFETHGQIVIRKVK